MIKVTKPIMGPAKLAAHSAAENKRNERAYNRGKRKFTFKDGIYNSKEVKTLLKQLHHAKCCFCEKLQSDEDGAVEHFRPKGGYQNATHEALQTPGYYWLCYEWSNLYFVCDACNRNKKNLFPLSNNKNRATSHHISVAQELPLLLQPDGPKDPRRHIIFQLHQAAGTTKFGSTTIDVCCLNRDALSQSRLQLLSFLKILMDVYEQPVSTALKPAIRDEIKQRLLKCQQAEVNK